MKLAHLILVLAALGMSPTVSARPAEGSAKEELRKSLKDFDDAASWVYDDLESAFAMARRTAKPLLVVFR